MKKYIVSLLLLGVASMGYAQSSYSGTVEVGLNSEYHLFAATSHGVLINPHVFAGGGVGITTSMMPMRSNERDINSMVVPLYLEGQYAPLSYRIQPFGVLRMGIDSIYLTELGIDSDKSVYKSTAFVSPAIGVKAQLLDGVYVWLKFSGKFRMSDVDDAVAKQVFSYSLGLQF